MASSLATLAASACLSRLSGSSEIEALRAASLFCHSATRSCRSRTMAARFGFPVAPRTAIWASDAAASELRAHCAVWNISAANAGSEAGSATATRWADLTSPQKSPLNFSASLFPLPVWTRPTAVLRSLRRMMTPVLRLKNSTACGQSRCTKDSNASLLSAAATSEWSGSNVFSRMESERLKSGSASA